MSKSWQTANEQAGKHSAGLNGYTGMATQRSGLSTIERSVIWVNLAKVKRVKLTGKKLKALYDAVYRRDSGLCVVCGAPVEYGVKFHHEPCGSYRSDEPSKVVMLCHDCHFKRHNTGESDRIRTACIRYLQQRYGEKGAKKE